MSAPDLKALLQRALDMLERTSVMQDVCYWCDEYYFSGVHTETCPLQVLMADAQEALLDGLEIDLKDPVMVKQAFMKQLLEMLQRMPLVALREIQVQTQAEIVARQYDPGPSWEEN